MTQPIIKVDDGYVRLVDWMGDDLTVVNAARVSFAKHKGELGPEDAQLINYLASNGHLSPMRQVQFSLEIHTSEVVLRQLYKHQVGIGYHSDGFREVAQVWNEISGRYVEFQDNYHVPTTWRTQATSSKQASNPDVLLDTEGSAEAALAYQTAMFHCYQAYHRLLDLGVCREQARMVLPLSFMTTVYMTASLEALVHLIRLRDHSHAQLEIRKIAQAVKELITPICPISVAALLRSR